ncbi:diguanylate cyclase [Reinekea sp.]|jgi:diguanylate cyclase (GGDEF)-like protein|uniref:diguanylate cyclase n=1 Tax=Reinekea sp. TaxID=1970455 RepID=UPI00398A0502
MKLVTRLKILSLLSLVSLLMVLGYLVVTNFIFLELQNKQQTMHRVNLLLSELSVNADLYLEIRDTSLLKAQDDLNDQIKMELASLSELSPYFSLNLQSIVHMLDSNYSLLQQLSRSFKAMPDVNNSADIVSHLKTRLSGTYILAQNDANILSDELWNSQLGMIQRWGGTLALLVMLTIAIVVFSHLNFANRFRASVSLVLNGLSAIKDGNLKTIISMNQKNELSDIAEGVNDMARNLNSLTISKSELEAQISARTIELQVQTRTDALTGIHNRRSLNRVGERELNMARRYDQNLSVLMIDLDHFKMVNDTYGHTFGDRVLIQATELISTQLRDSDFLARYGGEEFTVLLPHTDETAALEIAERIRLAFEQKMFGDGEQEVRQTISVGISDLTDTCFTLGDLIVQADKQLYEAKRLGRNRCYSTSL